MKSAICLFIATAQAAWPEYTTDSFSSAGAPTAVEIQTQGTNAYACLRDGLSIVNKLATSTIWAYTTAADYYGTASQAASTIFVTADDWGCCQASANGLTACTSEIILATDSTGFGGAADTWAFADIITGAGSTTKTYTAWSLTEVDGTANTDIVPEFMLAATYQMAPASPRVTTTDYCDVQSTELTAESMVSLSTGFDAFTGLTKCTYFLSTAVASGLAPAWKLVDSVEATTAKFWDYELVTAEYFTLELSASSAAGAPYALPTGVAKVPNFADSNVVASPTGNEVGVMDYSAMAPPPMMNKCAFVAVTMNKELWGGYEDMDVAHACDSQMKEVQSYNEMLEQYDEVLEEFETMQEEYNTARTAENTRREGFFSNAFDPVIAVPHRPMAPWTPANYAGIPAVYAEPASGGNLDMTAYFPAVGTRDSGPTEFIAHMMTHTGSVGGSDLNMDATGHVFGISGQGSMSMPGDEAMAYTNHIVADGTGISATDQAVMMVSIFPNDATTTGLATRNITLQASAVPFYANFTELPFFADTPEAPVVDLVAGVDGAKALTAGAALAALTLSLF